MATYTPGVGRGRRAADPPTLRHKCGTSAAQVRHKCGTSAEQVRHKCGTSAAQVRHKCGTSAAQVRHKCGTSADQVQVKCGAQCGSRAERRRMCGAASSGKNTPQKTQKHPPKAQNTKKDEKNTQFFSPSGLFAGTRRADPLRIRGEDCGTAAAPVRHRCGTGAEPVRIVACRTGAERVRNGRGTPAERRRICGAASSGGR